MVAKLKRFARELTEIRRDPVPFSCLDEEHSDFSAHTLQIVLEGVPSTPYEGGRFFMEMQYPEDYPFKPLRVKFLTPIYHPNINIKGQICVDILSNQWNPTLTCRTTILSVLALLSAPNFESPLVPEIAIQYERCEGAFKVFARQWVEQYAKPVSLEDQLQIVRNFPPRLPKFYPEFYPMNNKRRGVALIIMYDKFSNPVELSDLPGYNVDTQRLRDTFEHLGFTVNIHCRLTMSETLGIIELYAKNQLSSTDDCFVLVLLSHGNGNPPNPWEPDATLDIDGSFYASDGQQLRIFRHLVAPFCASESLKDKPKLFFIQTCRSKDTNNTNTVHMRSTAPQKDMLLSFATSRGGTSYVNRDNGSFYIQTLCDHLDSLGCEEDLLTLLSQVSGQVYESYEQAQLPQLCSSLSKGLRFQIPNKATSQ